MFKRTVTDEDMARLRAEREAADRAYNDALTAVDLALPRDLAPPSAVPRPDEETLTALQERVNIVPAELPAGGRGLRGRLAGFVWHLIGPMLQRQQQFNAATAEHARRQVVAAQAASQAIETSLWALHENLGALVAFQSQLILYLQEITLFVDTKDRQLSGEIRQITDMLDHRTVGLSAGLSGLGDEMLKRWESALAREQRFESRVTALTSTYERDITEFRTSLGVLQRSAGSLQREVERALSTHPAAAPGDRVPAATGDGVPAGPMAAAAGDRVPAATAASSTEAASQLAGSPVVACKYVTFEDTFRGSAEEIRSRLSDYLPLFDGASDVIDLGCGRGEFLDLLREHGISSRGVDINHEMVEVCRERGLDVVEGDGLAFLEAAPDGSVGGLFAAQVVEHLQPDQLLRLLGLAFYRLRPGSRIVLETINPACWFAYFESYIRDITHVRPVHPDTLKFLLQASGFQQVDVQYRAPYPERSKLQPIPIPAPIAGDKRAIRPIADLAETFNANVDKINRLLFTYLDYAAVGVRP